MNGIALMSFSPFYCAIGVDQRTTKLLSRKEHPLRPSCFRGEETEVQREGVTCPRPQGCSAAALETEETQASDSQAGLLFISLRALVGREALLTGTCVQIRP